MTEPVIRLSVGAPSTALPPDGVAAAVESAMSHAASALGLTARVEIEVVPDDALWLGDLQGSHHQSEWATWAARATAERHASMESASASLAIRAWATAITAEHPTLLVTHDVARVVWDSHAGPLLGRDAPPWWRELVNRLVSLGYGMTEGIPTRQLRGHLDHDEAQVEVLAERILAARECSVTLSAADDTFADLAALFTREDALSLDDRIQEGLGELRPLAPALTLLPDDTVPPDHVVLRLGHLPVALLPVASHAMSIVQGPPTLAGELDGYLGYVELPWLGGTGWTFLRPGSDADRSIREYWTYRGDEYLVTAMVAALVRMPWLLPDSVGVTALLDALTHHVGSGHTVWFGRIALSTEELLVVLRRMLVDGFPFTDFVGFIREVLGSLEMVSPEPSAFAAALDDASARWRVRRSRAHELEEASAAV